MSTFLQLAPMQSMTDIFFMNAYHQLFGGFNEMMTPYLLASSKSPIKLQTLKRQFDGINPEINLIPQLLSNDAKGFIHYSNGLKELGFKKVNWNLGCPYPFVAKKKRGSGLLPYPKLIDAILQELDIHLALKLSVKVRLGQYTEHEILDLIDVFNNHNIDEIIIHPRTADQKYEGIPKLETFAEIYQQFKAPVIYNGDIIHLSDFVRVKKLFSGVKGFMIGRGAFINPFITQQIAGEIFSDDEKNTLYKKFYYQQHNHFKQKTKDIHGFLCRMKELWFYFAQSFENGDNYYSKLRTITELSLFEQEVDQIFNDGKLIL